uniref:DRBM domain-containing protein n=1 Tax=Aplanochytrium stocchinoi TaxID=215587 RepID=A0A7S3LPL1_9STRA
MLVESDIDIDGDSTVSCALAIIGAAFVDGSYELAEKMVNKWLFKDLFEHYEENKELLFSAPLSEELQGPNPKAQLNSFFTKFPGQYKPNYLLKIASTNSAGLKRTQFVFSLGIEDYHVPTKRIDNLAPGMGISQRAAHEDAARNFIKILEHDERNIVKRLTYIKSTEEERLEHQQIKIESGMKIKKEEATSKNKTKDDDQESDDDDTVAEQSPSYQPASPPYEELAHLWEYDYEDKYRIKLQNDNCILKNINELCRRYLSVEKLDWEEWDNGEPHQRSFTAKLTILGKVYAIAKGNSKKGAKKKAALEAYPKLFHQRTDNSDH